MKTVFEKITESPESLAEFLSTDTKDSNKGCLGCESRDVCTGNETCKSAWLDTLNSEA